MRFEQRPSLLKFNIVKLLNIVFSPLTFLRGEKTLHRHLIIKFRFSCKPCQKIEEEIKHEKTKNPSTYSQSNTAVFTVTLPGDAQLFFPRTPCKWGDGWSYQRERDHIRAAFLVFTCTRQSLVRLGLPGRESYGRLLWNEQ